MGCVVDVGCRGRCEMWMQGVDVDAGYDVDVGYGYGMWIWDVMWMWSVNV